MHAYLGNWIYQNQTFMDFVRPALWAGLVLFFHGPVAGDLSGPQNILLRCVMEETKRPEFDECGEAQSHTPLPGLWFW